MSIFQISVRASEAPAMGCPETCDQQDSYCNQEYGGNCHIHWWWIAPER
jgi:hypothetical protein